MASTGGSSPTPSSGFSHIRQPVFTTVKRGFAQNEVLQYLNRVADDVEALESRVRQLESEVQSAVEQRDSALQAQTKPDPYESASKRIADIMRTFDQDVERLRAEAEAEAGRIIAQANGEAARIQHGVGDIRQQAQAEADGILADARKEADRIRYEEQSHAQQVRAEAEQALRDAHAKAERALSDLVGRRQSIVEELRNVREHLHTAVKELESVLDLKQVPGQLREEDGAGSETGGSPAAPSEPPQMGRPRSVS